MNPLILIKVTAIASPKINIIVVELVGARLFGQASIGFLKIIPQSDFLYSIPCLFADILNKGILKRFE